MTLRVLLGVGLSVLFLFPDGSYAQGQPVEAPTPEEVEAARQAPLFSSQALLVMTLEADFRTIRRDDRRDEVSEERPGTMRWENPDGTTETQEIQLQTRGNFRLAKRNCDFPPLRINVKKESTKGTLFEGQDKLKLVVPCKLRQDYWEQYVVQEYLVYRTLNILTELSFRVRPALVTFVDSTGRDDTFTRFTFLIEDDSQMAVRNGGRKEDWEGGQLDPRFLHKTHGILVDVFQFMIGNTDWSGVEMHNMELFRRPMGPPSTVPYDFDFSGMVNARYAEPARTLPIRSVRDRLFRGFCPADLDRSREDYEEVFQLFRDKREEIYQLWREQRGLDPEVMRESLAYLDEFYAILNDPKLIQEKMLDYCRPIRAE